MHRAFRFARLTFVLIAPALAGCGDSDSAGAVDRSTEAVQADNRGQDAMREFMQSKSKKPAKAEKAAKVEKKEAEVEKPE
ncbi:hypothetical protein [Paludisphaera soli]|uniref:hypothetical protein n=1 Tax=Paludisphaera soli TaxID=2712865 RepID=UPI0013ED58B3|nr:hypothetical protein [Paludisphaera soli]